MTDDNQNVPREDLGNILKDIDNNQDTDPQVEAAAARDLDNQFDEPQLEEEADLPSEPAPKVTGTVNKVPRIIAGG